jgi:hypothetical protein
MCKTGVGETAGVLHRALQSVGPTIVEAGTGAETFHEKEGRRAQVLPSSRKRVSPVPFSLHRRSMLCALRLCEWQATQPGDSATRSLGFWRGRS